MNEIDKNNILFVKLLIHISKSDASFDKIEIDIINNFIKARKVNKLDFKNSPNFKYEQLIDELPKNYLLSNKNIVMQLIASDNELNVNEGKILQLINKKIEN